MLSITNIRKNSKIKVRLHLLVQTLNNNFSATFSNCLGGCLSGKKFTKCEY